ncbi:hypothetical protein, partial [Vibrio hyugaensis]|uniref:hypothetical protein n=1 Tax=Vibrio hyugaensis TaxID=1534743 RepID=UPI003DA05F60
KYRDRDLRSLIKKNPTEKGGVRHQSDASLLLAFSLAFEITLEACPARIPQSQKIIRVKNNYF